MKLIIAGFLGRMGRMLVQHVQAMPGVELVGATVQPQEMEEAKRLAVFLGLPGNFIISSDIAAILPKADGVIDFTVPEHTLQIARTASEHGKVHICGTTGLSPEQQAQLATAAKHARIVHASNMSIGVNLLFKLVEQVGAILDESYDIEIVEMHHRHKVDAPSGTALSLGESAAKGRNTPFKDVAERGRDGITGERVSGNIGFAALRGGDVVGDHTVVFAGAGERIELTHKASSREIYARGALRAAQWAMKQPPGLYSMQDVLGLTMP